MCLFQVLIQAIGTDDAELVEVMLDLNVDPDSPVDDVYLLHFAAEMNAVRSIQARVYPVCFTLQNHCLVAG